MWYDKQLQEKRKEKRHGFNVTTHCSAPVYIWEEKKMTGFSGGLQDQKWNLCKTMIKLLWVLCIPAYTWQKQSKNQVLKTIIHKYILEIKIYSSRCLLKKKKASKDFSGGAKQTYNRSNLITNVNAKQDAFIFVVFFTVVCYILECQRNIYTLDIQSSAKLKL